MSTLPLSDVGGTRAEEIAPIRFVESLGKVKSKEEFHESAAPYDRGDSPTLADRFPTKAAEAVPVYERASEEIALGSQQVGTTALQVFPRRPGRKTLVISIPTTFYPVGSTVASTPTGVQVAQSESVITSGLGYQLQPGDSVEIDTEGPVFVGPLPGQAQGTFQYVETYTLREGYLR
ncbi:MAG: hypothetical protein KGI98_17495 [Euryarchaeota archaeon]|nr:hypothetical protein [Euryarchaeota archaeon]